MDFISLSLLLLTGTVLAVLFWAIDSWFRPLNQGTGIVSEKRFFSAQAQKSLPFISTLVPSFPTPGEHHDKWIVEVEMKGVRGNIRVSEERYHSFHRGQSVVVDYRTGRISGCLYVVDICGAV
jgi:hypothetical protein